MPVAEHNRVEDVRSTRLKSWGTSQGVRIPKRVCSLAGIGPDGELSMETGADENGCYILLRPAGADGHRRYGAGVEAASLDELFEGYGGAYEPRELDWGPDVGSEVVE